MKLASTTADTAKNSGFDRGLEQAYLGYAQAAQAFEGLVSSPGLLSQKERELILLAATAAVTHLYGAGIRRHVEGALAQGASRDEIMEVVQLSSVLGVHSMSVGLPILMNVLKQLGREAEVLALQLSPEQHRLKQEWIAERGFWHELPEQMLKLAPRFFEAYVQFSTAPWRLGTLEPKFRELIYVAIDISTTHLYEDGTRIHITNALDRGASPQEIVEVMAVVSTLSLDTLREALPVLSASSEGT